MARRAKALAIENWMESNAAERAALKVALIFFQQTNAPYRYGEAITAANESSTPNRGWQ